MSLGLSAAGSRNSSLAQAPKSRPLQRALQNGRLLLLVAYTEGPLQAGQLTIFSVSDVMPNYLIYAHKVSSKAVSALMDCIRSCIDCCTNRIDTTRRLALISGIAPKLGSIASRNN